ncbi:MAG: hypothetical protein GXP25_16810, partial [Planctomycetes bacterium]|nr:hypothetical protein [Planctomycetota bacterium]
VALIDPPYKMTATPAAMAPLEGMLGAMAEKDLFAADAVLMIHHGRRVFTISSDLPFEIVDERWYGTSGLALLRWKQ